MNLIEIGKFIAECRKSKNLTQLELANILHITDRAISKWENGRSLPDASIMIDLCKVLDITVNELLCGERISMDNYNNEMEANLLKMVKEKENADKHLLRLEIIYTSFATIVALTLIALGSFLNIEIWLRLVLIAAAIIIVVIAIIIALGIEQKAGCYVCPHCGNIYIPSYKSVVFSLHIDRTRYMKCPNCGKRGWHKKTISKDIT